MKSYVREELLMPGDTSDVVIDAGEELPRALEWIVRLVEKAPVIPELVQVPGVNSPDNQTTQ